MSAGAQPTSLSTDGSGFSVGWEDSSATDTAYGYGYSRYGYGYGYGGRGYDALPGYAYGY